MALFGSHLILLNTGLSEQFVENLFIALKGSGAISQALKKNLVNTSGQSEYL